MSIGSENLLDCILFGPDHPPKLVANDHSSTGVEKDSISQDVPSPQETCVFAPGLQWIESNNSSPTVGPNHTAPKSAKNEITMGIEGLPRPRLGPRPLHPAVAYWKALWHCEQHAWSPRILQLRPFVGGFAICVIVGCVLASFAVLLLSDGQATADWSLSPSTTLAIITAVANSAVALAYMEAVPISWWYSATRGRSIRALERQWQVSRSSVMAIAYLRNLSLLNLACIAAAYVVIDGPLLQKASTVIRATQSNPVKLSFDLLPELPNGYSGHVQNGVLQNPHEITHIFSQYSKDEPIKLAVDGCQQGQCHATVQAPGVAKTNCSVHTWDITPSMLRSQNATWGPWRDTGLNSYGVPTTTLSSFYVNLAIVNDYPSSAAELKVGLYRWIDLRGDYVMTTCLLLPAIAEYDVVLQGGIVRLKKSADQGRVVDLANNTRSIYTTLQAYQEVQQSTMDSPTLDTSLIVNSNASMIWSQTPGHPASYVQDPRSYNQFASQHFNYSHVGTDFSWWDPTSDIIHIMNEFMFRAGVFATSWGNLTSLLDPGITEQQTVAGVQEVTHNVYKSDMRWCAGAAVVQLATALLILPMFWGWWKMECSNNLSPCAIALAFDSPILRDVNSASQPREIVDTVGAIKLKYGDVGGVASDGVDEGGTAYASGRLGIGEIGSVVQPRKGRVFLR